MKLEARAAWVGLIASLGLHMTLALFLLRLPNAAEMSLAAGYELELRVADPEDAPADDVEAGSTRDAPAPLVPGGGRSRQNVDALTPGERGDDRGARAVILLLPQAHEVHLQDSPMNAVRASQTQRIRTADDRATRDMRRATPNPNEQPFLASGPGAHPERRPVSARDAHEGARVAPEASERGARATTAPSATGVPTTEGNLAVRRGAPSDAEAEALRGAPAERETRAGADVASPGRGIARGAGEIASEAARVATGRPPVDRGPAAAQAESVDGRIRDNADAELLAARMMQSLVEASPRSGREVGEGRGGVGGGGAPGVGGSPGEGGRARPDGPGGGAYASLDTSDARYHRWYLSLVRRVQDRLAFPRARMLAMDQGLSVYRFVVRPDGQLVGHPSLVRSSGFSDFDQAARVAIEEAAPFPPLPPELVDGVDRHAVRMTIEHSNPMVE